MLLIGLSRFGLFGSSLKVYTNVAQGVVFMNKKVGILTFHRGLSYGANLQAYGLQNFLLKNGIDNEIVDYSCQDMIDRYQKIFRKTKGNKIKGLAWNLMTAGSVIQKKKATTEFVENNLRLSKGYTAQNIQNANSEYSAFITGSDQVWSPTCVGFDPVYFLTFADSSKKYSYAASIATNKIPENMKEEYIKRVGDFSAISLREKSGAELITSLTGRKTAVHIDPSMLLTREDWDKICCESYPKEKYILLFTVPKPSQLVNYAIKLAEEKDLKIYFLNNFGKKVRHKRIKYLKPVGITEFISLIKHAEYVCTNSFHGNAFSILYHKNFVVETDAFPKRNIRSEDLMLRLGLKHRILSSKNTPEIDLKTDWSSVDRLLENDRKEALLYLQSI